MVMSGPDPAAGSGAGVTGVDPQRLASWLEARVPGLATPLEVVPIAGGRSNLTSIVSDAMGRRYVVRRPPIHGVLPSAHDMGRESDIQRALAGTGVPVPGIVDHEPDASVLGAPFYVMEHVAGRVLRDEHDAEGISHDERRTIGMGLVDTLLELHHVDPVAVGLGPGSERPYLLRQLRTWSGQLEALAADDDRRTGALLALGHRLMEVVPPQRARCIVHGDYRLDNVLLGPEGRIAAILDWELWTIGDPLADLATLAVYWSQPDDPVLPLGDAATLLPGFPTRDEIVARYRAGTDLPLDDLPTYLAFSTWRLATILEGVLQRQRSGGYGGQEMLDGSGRPEWQRLAEVVPALTEQVADRIRALG